jgi:creatinine amidohydrolase
MDLATELGEQGFRWVFVVHAHGSPFHNLVLDQAGDYFRDTYGGRMVHLRGLKPTGTALQTEIDAAHAERI